MSVMTMPRTSPGLEAAFDLTESGWWVYPTLAGRKGGMKNCDECRDGECGGKHKCTTGWCHAFYSATNDPDEVEARWPVSDKVDCSVHVGKSGLTVIDVDGPDGVAWMRKACADGLLVPTRMYRSSSGEGYHLYYRGTVAERWDRAHGLPVDVKSGWNGTARWTGDTEGLPVREIADLTPELRAWATKPAPVAPPVVSPSSASFAGDCPTATHRSPEYLKRGVEMTVELLEAIPAEDGTGRTAQVTKILAGFIYRHGCCATDEDYAVIREATRACGKYASLNWQRSFTGYRPPAS